MWSEIENYDSSQCNIMRIIQSKYYTWVIKKKKKKNCHKGLMPKMFIVFRGYLNSTHVIIYIILVKSEKYNEIKKKLYFWY